LQSLVQGSKEQTALYFIVSLFEILTDLKPEIPRFKWISDIMGTLEIDLFIGSGEWYFWLKYLQEIDEDYHSVNRKAFETGYLFPDNVELNIDLYLISSLYIKLGIENLSETKKSFLLKLFHECFHDVRQKK
jgi:hypothetical protein